MGARSYLSVMAQHLLLPLPGRVHTLQGMVQLLQTAGRSRLNAVAEDTGSQCALAAQKSSISVAI